MSNAQIEKERTKCDGTTDLFYNLLFSGSILDTRENDANILNQKVQFPCLQHQQAIIRK